MNGWRTVILSILLAAVLAGPIAAFQTTDSIEAASNVYVSNITYSPGSFYPGDEGTVTVKVTNGNTNTGVVVNHATLYDNENKFKVTSPPFTSSTNIGPGQTQTFVFTVVADGVSEGTFFPIFSLSFRDADSLWHRTSVDIDDTPLQLTVTDRPDTFTSGGKDIVKIQVWNPRESSVRDVTIVPTGDGITTTPMKAYVGELAAGASKEVTFEVTPTTETTLGFTAEYNNGDNEHEVAVSMPIAFGADKTGADLVVNNIESSSSGTAMTIKGDVTNNGLTDAKSVIVSVGSPAKGINPNPVYAIGNLEPDDFSSFEVTYMAPPSMESLPLIVEYKDVDGNVFTEKYAIDASSGTMAAPGAGQGAPGAAAGQAPGGQRRGLFGSFGSGMNQVPVTGIVVILVGIIVLAIAWKKGYIRKITGRFAKKTDEDPLPDES